MLMTDQYLQAGKKFRDEKIKKLSFIPDGTGNGSRTRKKILI